MNPLKSLSLTVAMLTAGTLSADTMQPAPTLKSAAKPAHETAEKPVDKIKAEWIKKLLAAGGIVNANVDAAKKSIEGMKKNSTGIDEKFWEDLANLATHKAFENLLIPVYDETYTLDEIKGITRFYFSDTGKAFLTKNSQALIESGKAFQSFMEAGSKSLMAKRSAAKPAGAKKN